MSFTPRPVRRSPGSPSPNSNGGSGGSGSRVRSTTNLSHSNGSTGTTDRPDVDMAQFGILGWKEYALLKYSDSPKFYNSAIGKDLIVESAMWELQQKLIAISAWADEVEVAAFELESNLRKEKKARLKAESKLRKLQEQVTRSPPHNLSESLIEQSKESLVRSPPRATSPLEATTRAMSPPRVGGLVSSPLSPERSRSPLTDKSRSGTSASPAPHRRGSAARPRSASPAKGLAGKGDSADGSSSGGASASKEKMGGKGFASLVSSVFGRSKNKLVTTAGSSSNSSSSTINASGEGDSVSPEGSKTSSPVASASAGGSFFTRPSLGGSRDSGGSSPTAAGSAAEGHKP